MNYNLPSHKTFKHGLQLYKEDTSTCIFNIYTLSHSGILFYGVSPPQYIKSAIGFSLVLKSIFSSTCQNLITPHLVTYPTPITVTQPCALVRSSMKFVPSNYQRNPETAKSLDMPTSSYSLKIII